MATTSRKPASKKTKTTRKSNAASTRKTTTKKVTTRKKPVRSVSAKTSTAINSSLASKAQKSSAGSTSTSRDEMQKMRSLNLFVAFANIVQAGLILWLSKAFGGIRAVNLTYPTNDTLATANASQPQIVNALHRLFDVHLSWLVAAFLIITAVMHLAAATWMRKRYEREVSNKVNRLRWMTYAVAGSLTLVTIALAAGINDLTTLLAVVTFNVLAALTALSREHYTQNRERSRLVYGIGAIAAAAPWVIFLLNVLGTHQYGEGGTPKNVYWLYFTGAVLVMALAKNLREQTRARGRWTEYLYAEKVYVWLSLIGTSAVAWQIYAAFLKK